MVPRLPRNRLQICLLVIAIAALSGCGSSSGGKSTSEPGSLQALVSAAKSDGSLKLVGIGNVFGGDATVQKIVDLMNKTYGTNINVTQAPGPSQQQFLEQIATENQAGQTASSDVLAATPFQFGSAQSLNFLQHPNWSNISGGTISSDLVDTQVAVRVATGLAAIVYNTKFIPADQAPTTLKALLEPKWKGKIATTPYAAGFDVLSVDPSYGAAGALDYAKKFSGQVNALVRCAGPEIDQLTTGASQIMALGCNGAEEQVAIRKGAPLAQIIPLDAAQKRYEDLAVPSNAAHPAAAELFIITMLSSQGQQIEWNDAGWDNDLLPGSHVGAKVKQAESKGATFISPDIAYLRSHPQVNDTQTKFVQVLKEGH